MERREYKFSSLLNKIGLASIIGAVYASIFTELQLYHSKAMSTYIWIDDICLSALLAIPLIFYFVKVMMTLIENGKFSKNILMKNHFIIYLMIVMFVTQISKHISFTMNFHFYDEYTKIKKQNECTRDFDKDQEHFQCVVKKANFYWDSTFI